MKHDANTKETGTPHHTLCANETTTGTEVCILFGRVWSNPQRLLWCCLFVNSRRPSASYSQKKYPMLVLMIPLMEVRVTTKKLGRRAAGKFDAHSIHWRVGPEI